MDDPSTDPRRIYEDEQKTPGGRWLNINGGSACMHQPVRMVPMRKSSAGRELDGRTWEQMPRCAA
ncbi:hypothetical protein FGG78_22290 [Thioclava sp. BHET1]|nr:hypothetical protein FGG78_22290 [Thioclava sp. BHET1]